MRYSWLNEMNNICWDNKFTSVFCGVVLTLKKQCFVVCSVDLKKTFHGPVVERLTSAQVHCFEPRLFSQPMEAEQK